MSFTTISKMSKIKIAMLFSGLVLAIGALSAPTTSMAQMMRQCEEPAGTFALATNVDQVERGDHFTLTVRSDLTASTPVTITPPITDALPITDTQGVTVELQLVLQYGITTTHPVRVQGDGKVFIVEQYRSPFQVTYAMQVEDDAPFDGATFQPLFRWRIQREHGAFSICDSFYTMAKIKIWLNRIFAPLVAG